MTNYNNSSKSTPLSEASELALNKLTRKLVARVQLRDFLRSKHEFSLSQFSKDPDYQKVKEWFSSLILPELDGTENLDGFSLNDLREFLGHLYLRCSIAVSLSEFGDRESGPPEEVSSYVIQGDLQRLSHCFAQDSLMEISTISNIIEFLTFSKGMRRASLKDTPFVKTSCGTISLLSRVVVSNDPNKMVSAALARGSRKKVYEKFIKKIEASSLKSIARVFERAGFNVITDQKVKAKGEIISPDFWVYEPTSCKLMIIDYKHALPSAGASKVINRISDVNKWINRIEEYCDFARRNNQVVLSRIRAESISSISGLLLLRWPLLLPISSDSDVQIVDWDSLSMLFEEKEKPKIDEILTCLDSMLHPNKASSNVEVGLKELEINVGDWTYKRFVTAFRA